jgi:alpha-L-arabinofuranosidase
VRGWPLVAVLAVACHSASGLQLPAPGRTLQNPSFDETGGSPRGWTLRGSQFARAEIVQGGAPSPPHMLLLTVSSRGSSGNDSFMAFQTLDPAAYRGKRVRFGARIRTEGAGINLALYTPEGSSNDFTDNVSTGGFMARAASGVVPDNATFLSFGIQIFGPRGAKAWIDDVFVTIDSSDSAGATRDPDRSSPAAVSAPRITGTAQVHIDADQVVRDVSSLLFGMHIEWVENGVGLLDPRRGTLRREVVDLLQPLRIPFFRFPGGIHADYYDWRDGIGPANNRRNSANVFTKRDERHRFGTPELAELLRVTGGKALITANYGTGTPQLAAGWAAHLKKGGIPADWWEVGNEIYLADPNADAPNGRKIYRAPEQYARDYPAFRIGIKESLPQARVGAIAHLDTGAFSLAPPSNRDWTVRMLQALGTRADFFAVHNAYAPVIIDDRGRFDDEASRREQYRSLYAAARQVPENLDALDREIARRSPQNAGVPYAITEFGPFFGLSGRPQVHATYVDQSRTLAAAIYVASIFDVLLDDPRVFLAAYTNPIHPWYGSLITDTDGRLVLTPTYHLFQMYRTRFEPHLLATTTTSPSFDAKPVGIVKAHTGVSDLVARASTSADRRRLTVMLVNRSVERRLQTTVSTGRFVPVTADCRLLSAVSPSAQNGPALTATTTAGAKIVPLAMPCTPSNQGLALELPPNTIASVVMAR